MILTRDKLRLKKMISDSITVLCRAGLPFESKLQVEALIGITLDDNEVVLFNLKETMSSSGLLISGIEYNGENEARDVDDENFNSEHANLSLSNIPKCLEWETSSNISNLDNRQPFDHYQAQFSEACCDAGNQIDVSSSKILRQKKRKAGDRALQSEALKYESIDAVFHSMEYDPKCTDSKSFHALFEIQSHAHDDDCVIVKSEESGTNECYELDEQEQINTFHEDDYSNFQAVEPSDNMNNSTYFQNSTWTPHFAKPLKKFKLPVHQKCQMWTSKSTPSLFKSRCAKPSVKLSKDTPSASSEAPDDSIIGRAVMQCAYCDAVFNSSRILKEHVNGVHFKKKLYRCLECGESFKWRAELSRHRRVPGLCPCDGFGR